MRGCQHGASKPRRRPSRAPAGTLLGYARCSTDKQDLTAQGKALRELGVPEKQVYLNRWLTGRHRARRGLAKRSPPCAAAKPELDARRGRRREDPAPGRPK